MKFPRYIASTAVRETGLVRAQDIGALTNIGGAEFQAIEQAGRAISGAADLSAREYLQRQAIDDDIEAGDVNLKDLEIIKRGLETARNYVPSMDEVLPDDANYLTKTTAAIFSNEVKAKVRADILNGYEKDSAKLYSNIKSPRIKARLIAQRNARLPDYIEAIDKELNRTHEKYQVRKVTNYAGSAAANGDIDIAMHWIDRGIEHGLFDDAVGDELKTNLMKEFFQNSAVRDTEATIAALHEEMAARKKGKGEIPEDIMTDADLNQSLNDALTVQKENIVAFENDINSKFVTIDNTPDMLQADFDSQARILKASISLANIPGTQKRKMLADLERWRRGTGEIDYARQLALNQEMDAAQRSGIVDPTIKDRIINAHLEGAFGGRNKGGQKNYGIMIRRFETLKFDERVQATVFIVKAFERENADDPRLIFLFHQAKNKIITESPDASTRELFIEISALAEAYSVLPESTIIQEMTQEGTVPKRKPQELHTPPGPAQGTIPSTKQLEQDLKTEPVEAKPLPKQNVIVEMQAGTVRQSVGLGAVGTMLDRGLKFPIGSGVIVKRNPTDKDIEFEGLTIKPGKRVISLNGGKTWQLLP